MGGTRPAANAAGGDFRQHFAGGGGEGVHLVERVRQRDEGGLELRRRQQESTFQHPVEELGVLGGVRLLGAGQVDHLFGGEEEREGGADPLHAGGDAGAADGTGEIVLQHPPDPLQRDVRVVVEALERGQAGRDRHRVS